MNDDTLGRIPGPDDFPADPLDVFCDVLPAAIEQADDDNDAVMVLAIATAVLCSVFAFDAYRGDDWVDSDDRETYAHLALTVKRMCSHILSGLSLLSGGAKDPAWTLLDGAARCATEIHTMLVTEAHADDETERLARLVDLADGGATTAELDSARRELEEDVAPAGDGTAARIALLARVRPVRTPGLFLDEDRLGDRYRELAVDLLRGTLHEFAETALHWGIDEITRLEQLVAEADADRLRRFHGRRAA